MKLIIQIPCYNEEKTLPETLADLPEEVEGVEEVQTLVINDGSTDRTVEVARKHGVDHILNMPCNKGLAAAWSAGLDHVLGLGADIIVNTDGDNQYCGADIPALVRPIVDGEAEMVIGARPIEEIGHFSWLKKRLQRFGSWVVSICAGVKVDDAASGFRAYSAGAARELNLISDYSHCTETLIRAARRGIKIANVSIRVNEKLRDSRLMKSLPGYLWRQGRDIFRIATMVHPLKVFGIPSLITFLVGATGCLRFLYFYFTGRGSGHVQSLIFSAIFIIAAFVLSLMGLAADMISTNHQLIEDALVRLKRLGEKDREDSC
ncbi:MAG: glycosyltransferase family 2 protein [Candidatus Brocadiia bacterium]